MTDEELFGLAKAAEGEFVRRAAQHEDFRFDRAQNAFWDLTTMQLLKAESVNASIRIEDWETREKANGDIVPIPPAKTIPNIDTGLVVDAATWWPGKPRELEGVFVGDNGARPMVGGVTLNTYT